MNSVLVVVCARMTSTSSCEHETGAQSLTVRACTPLSAPLFERMPPSPACLRPASALVLQWCPLGLPLGLPSASRFSGSLDFSCSLPLRLLFLLFCHSCAKLFFVLVHHGLRCCVFVGVAHDSGKHARTCFCSWCAALWRTCIKCLVQHFLHIHALCVSCRSMENFTK